MVKLLTKRLMAVVSLAITAIAPNGDQKEKILPIITLNEKGEFELEEIDLDGWKNTFRRVLVNGPPLSGKTTSFLTFPPKRHIFIAPGELGHSSVREDETTKLYYWEFDPNSTNVQYMRTWVYVQRLTQEILAGKHGEVTTFCIDGLHKLYYVIMKAMGFTSNSDPKEYVKYHEAFANYMHFVLGGPTPFVVASSYDGNEAVEAGSKVTQIFPDLPGKMAKQVMGMFPVVLHSERNGELEKERFTWRLRASGKIQGVGMHLPIEIKKRFPAEIDQDWRKIEAIVNE